MVEPEDEEVVDARTTARGRRGAETEAGAESEGDCDAMEMGVVLRLQASEKASGGLAVVL